LSFPRQVFASPALLTDPIAQCLLLIALTSVFFLLFPRVDVWFSGLFYEPGNGFPVSRLGAFIFIRDVNRNLTWIVVVALLFALAAKIARPDRPAPVAPRDALYILSTLAIGPGVIVNLILKNNWGRPRPFTVDLFGGDHPFVGAGHMSNYCNTNCSFVAGEGSSSIWLLTLLVLVPERWRATATKVLLGFATVVSLNRIAFGGHFLSDVLMSWWITLAVMAVLYRILYVSPPHALTNDHLEAGLARLGTALRDAVFRARPPA
jgi:membrane-associated PAP2 superfamily phosphatase